MDHTCRAGGRRVGVLEWPPYAAPGEIVKVVGADRWGRVDVLFRCCGTIDVSFVRAGESVVETAPMALPDVVGVFFQDYPDNLPPAGRMIPRSWPRTGSAPVCVPFVG